MFINALRFRDDRGAWQAFRFNSGTGRFRTYACLAAPKADLVDAMAAVAYALTGRLAARVAEAELILSDDGGSTWTVRRAGGATEILKDGKDLGAATGERELRSLFIDTDLAPDTTLDDVARFDVDLSEGMPSVRTIGAFENRVETLRTVAERQIYELAEGAAKALKAPALANPALLARLSRALEPLNASYRELCAQYRDVQAIEKGELKNAGDTGLDEKSAAAVKDEEEAQALRAELKIIKEMAATAEPLLKPGVSLKTWRDEMQAVEAKIAEVASAHALGDGATATCPKDLSQPIDALTKLETAMRLLRASQAARKQCESDIEPLTKEYFDLAGRSLDRDEKITAELDSCLGALKIRLAAARARQDDADATDQNQDLNAGGVRDAMGLRTWFERFRSKEQEDLAARRDGPGVLDKAFGDGGLAELETACMTVEFALTKLRELNHGLASARPRFQSALGRLDAAHDELVKQHHRAKERWSKVAQENALPESMSLERLLLFTSDHARLKGLEERRTALGAAVNDATTRLSRLGHLVPEWRRVAKSQKAGDLASPQLLLTEAREIIRYLEAKERRLAQLKERSASAKNQTEIKAVLKTRRKILLGQWRDAFADAGIDPVDINHDGLPEALRRGNLVRALGIVVASHVKAPGTKPFEELAKVPTASMYMIGDAKTSNQARLELLNCLEEARGTELRLILVADDALAAMFGSLGIGLATRVSSPDVGPLLSIKAKEAPTLAPPMAPIGARPTLSRPRDAGQILKNPQIRGREASAAPYATQPARPTTITPAAPLLSEKARRALDLLHGRKT